jgi:hypothetical protein
MQSRKAVFEILLSSLVTANKCIDQGVMYFEE